MVTTPSLSDVDIFYKQESAALAILKLFFSVCHRWRRIRLTVKVEDVEEAMLILRTQQAPQNLEEYDVRVGTWSAAHVDELFGLLHSSTKLRSVDWGGSLSGSLRPDTPWSQIKELSLRFKYLSQDHLDALKACPVHQTKCSQFDDLTTLMLQPVALPNVRKLVVIDPTRNMRIFDALTLPLLNDLETSYSMGLFESSDLTPMVAMLRRSRCTLQSLALNGEDLPILFEAASAFEDIHTLKALTVLQESELILLAAYPSESEQPGLTLLPKLRNLILHNYKAQDGVLSTVVSSRRHELEVLHVCIPDVKAFPLDYQTLLRAKADGLSLTISGWVRPGRAVEFGRSIASATDDAGMTLIMLMHQSDTLEDLWLPWMDRLGSGLYDS
ncbi:hypothetical protein D9613_007391 [Agrocybe pediades]|uniref:Uncharacterized protein n=1 Tax=Agrocybe pediades TaxID=84607 RepID=A0A8H4QM90_9AGAR|nr:hypothetical protein D9613_007391 [Agrocybe pediades]